MSSRNLLVRPTRAALALFAGLFVFVGPVSAATTTSLYEVYSLSGYEVWFTPSVGTFVGIGTGSTGDLSGWYTAVEHSLAISPSGTVDGGIATLQRVDGVRMSGHFAGGTVRQTYDGPNCTNESHEVVGSVYDLTRSDRPGDVGIGLFNATLTHYRAWILGKCWTYSASVQGSFSLVF